MQKYLRFGDISTLRKWSWLSLILIWKFAQPRTQTWNFPHTPADTFVGLDYLAGELRGKEGFWWPPPNPEFHSCLMERGRESGLPVARSDSTTTGISPVYCRFESRMSQNVTVGRLHQRRQMPWIGWVLKSNFLIHFALLLTFSFEY